MDYSPFTKPLVLAFIFLTSAVRSAKNSSKPIVNVVAMESTGALDGGATYNVRYLLPLFQMTLEDAKEKFGQYLDIRLRHVETFCGPQLIGAQAAEEYYQRVVNVFLGPGKNNYLFVQMLVFFLLLCVGILD